MTCSIFCTLLAVILCLEGITLGSFPTCVEVIDVVPAPFSHVNKKPKFIVTFSKPVIRKNPKRDVFITPTLGKVREHRPKRSGQYDSSLQKYWFEFRMSREEARTYRSFYFIIDGGSFHAVEKIYKGYWTPYVQLSIYGIYYLFKSSSNRPPQPIVPSPYCFTREKRLFRRPKSTHTAKCIVEVSEENSELIQTSGNNSELLLSVITHGNGHKTIELPSTMKVVYRGHNATIVVPPKTAVTATRNEKFYRVPARTRIIHEVMERIYHGSFVRKIDLDLERWPTPRMPSDFMRASYRKKKVFFWRSKETNEYLIHSHTSNGAHYYYSFAGSMHAIPENVNIKYKPYNRVWYKCDPDSKRTAGSGRRGPVYHSLEYGPFYQLVIPNLDRVIDEKAARETKVKVNKKDVTKLISFDGPNIKSIISSYVKNIIGKYVFLLPPMVEDKFKTLVNVPLFNAIFVPKEMLHSSCNGILMFENLDKFKRRKDFCNNEFGHCIGLPFSSPLRFPDIPPFGEPGFLSNTGETSRTMKKYFEKIQAFYHYREKNKHFLYFRSSEEFPLMIRKIPVPGVRLLFPEFDSLSCKDICFVKKTHTTDSKLGAQLKNSGEGGADVTVSVKCTSSLVLLPPVERTIWIGPGEVGTIDFVVDGSKAATDKRKPHKCSMNITIHTPKEEKAINRSCSHIITTYSGVFTDPCKGNESTLPSFDLQYFVLPPAQRETSAASLTAFLQSKAGMDLVFMRAITVSLTIPMSQENLLSNLNLMQLRCSTDVAVMLEEEELLDFAKQGSLKDEKMEYKSEITYYSSLTEKRRIFYFAKRKWVSDHRQDSPSSKCFITLVANRPRRQCHSNPTKLKALAVPLKQSDIPAMIKEMRGDYWMLETVYGQQTNETMELLLGCIALLIFLLAVAIVSHAFLFICRKNLPNKEYLQFIEESLKKAITDDKKRWENPQMYLETCPHGNFYTLYNFKCTCSLDDTDTEELQAMRMAGLLRFKEKEQQIMFGHVKKVFVSRKRGSGDIYLQASSGMYLLKAKHVHEEYRDELDLFYERKKIVLKEE